MIEGLKATLTGTEYALLLLDQSEEMRNKATVATNDKEFARAAALRERAEVLEFIAKRTVHGETYQLTDYDVRTLLGHNSSY